MRCVFEVSECEGSGWLLREAEPVGRGHSAGQAVQYQHGGQFACQAGECVLGPEHGV